MMKSTKSWTVALGVAIAAGLPLHANANLVTNGDFETGNLTGWTQFGWGASAGIAGVSPYQGSLFATTGCATIYCVLSQNLATTPGQTYTLSFAFNPGQSVASGGGDFQVYWGGDATTNGTLVTDIRGGNLGWTLYSFNVTALSSTTELLFRGFQRPAEDGLDVVDVELATPLPAALPLFATGLGGLGLLGWRRKWKAQAV
jgi:hypothetical protein